MFAFIVAVDPFGSLPVSVPFARWPVDGNARYAFPALARSPRFDAAVFGTSTSRLLRPALLDAAFGAHFANLAMNSATAWEQAQLLGVFIRAHPAPRAILVGLDAEWCVTEGGLRRITDRGFPEWLYAPSRWGDYWHLFNLYTLEKAGQAFAEFAGLKPQVYGSDGYTRFVPPDASYDAARARAHLAGAPVFDPGGRREGPEAGWVYPGLDLLAPLLRAVPAATVKLLFFVPYSHVAMPPPGEGPIRAGWDACKRRAAAVAGAIPGTVAVDFMIPSAITDTDTNYWDELHYRQPVADLLVRDLAAAAKGEAGDGGYRILGGR